MNTPYTDVDRLMLDRWAEVNAMREAYDELLEKMTDMVNAASNRAGAWLGENGYEWDGDEKHPWLRAWRRDWEKPKGEPMVWLEIADFAPMGFGRVEAAHPWLWVMTGQLDRLKLREADRVRFARDLKAMLGPAAAKWEHADCDDESEPLGRYCTEVTDQQRLEMLVHPARLVEFLEAGFKELFELEPAISETLKRYRV